MNAKSIAMGVVAMVVATVLVVTCAVPIISDSVKTEDTFTNEGYFRMAKISATDESTYTISWDATTPNIITINDTDIDITTWGSAGDVAYSIFATESDIFRMGVANNGYNVSWIQLRGSTYAYVGATSNFDATIESGTATIEVDSTVSSYTLAYTDAYVIDPSGNYTMKKSNVSSYLLDDSTIYGMGITGVSSASYVMIVSGTVESVSTDYIAVTNDAPDLTVTDLSITSSEVSGYIDLYSFDKVTFKATPEGGSTPTNVTYSYVIVPYEVTAERSVHVDGPTGDILSVIPILMVLGIVIGAVALFLTTRRD